jgi:hypothetical protein
MFFSLLAYFFMAMRSGGSRLAITMFMLNPVVILDILKTNVNWIVPLGLLLPPWLGLFLVLIKPQVGIGLGVYWLLDSYRTGGLLNVVKTFLPVSVAYLLSFILFGPYLLHTETIVNGSQNFRLFWPYAVPVGIAIIVWTARHKIPIESLAASPMLSPYFGDTSWAIPFLALVRHKWLTVLLTFSLWILAFYIL